MRRLIRYAQVIALVLSAVSAGAWAIEPLEQAEPDAAWDAAFDRSDGWIGGDAIYSTPLPGGDVLWLFADTYIGTVREHRRLPGVCIVNNTLGLQRHRAGSPLDLPPRPDDLTFLWDSSGGAEHPQAWIRPPAQPAGNPSASAPWFWLADALVVPRPDCSGTARAGEQPPGRLLIFLWRVERTNAEVMNFRNAGCDMAIVDDPRADWTTWQPRQFSITHGVAAATGDEPRRAEIVWGSEVLLDPELGDAPHVLIYGYRQPLRGSLELVLARAPADQVERFDTWRFQTTNGWTPNPSVAATLANALTTEFSVSPVETAGKACYVLVQSEPFLGDRILTRTAPTPYGPWTAPRAVYRVPGLDRAKQHITYAAKAHPEVSRPGELLVSYVVNSLDFGESATNADIYRPRFVRVPLGKLPTAPPATRGSAPAK